MNMCISCGLKPALSLTHVYCEACHQKNVKPPFDDVVMDDGRHEPEILIGRGITGKGEADHFSRLLFQIRLAEIERASCEDVWEQTMRLVSDSASLDEWGARTSRRDVDGREIDMRRRSPFQTNPFLCALDAARQVSYARILRLRAELAKMGGR